MAHGHGQYVYFTVEDNSKDWIAYLSNITERTQLTIDEKLPQVRRATKTKVQSELYHRHGLDKGVYRKSFIINNFNKSKWQIGFQVYAKAPHYRLTHLLENGHRSSVFKRGQGKMTKWGNIGMVDIGRRGLNRKGTSQHIAVGQKFAEEKVTDLYQYGIEKIFSERMKKL